MSAEEPQVRRALMDADDWEYILGGHLVGTDWMFPDIGTDRIRRLQYSTERQGGERREYPEVVLDQSGNRIPVSGFLSRIDPNDVGDVEPAGRVARIITKMQRENSWQQVEMTFDGGA